ncbi:MAG: DUF1592 domain-containing protein [Planctomycetales bacterium]|nr:DUF1592 domain-containing protein [Planctomycetales bacterium]
MLQPTFQLQHRIRILCWLACLATVAPTLAQDRSSKLSSEISKQVISSCIDCHGTEEPAADLSISSLLDKPMAGDFKSWRKVVFALESGLMPPEDSSSLDKEQRRQLGEEIEKQLHAVVASYETEPGSVTMRRLTSAEYDYVVRDLTGISFDLGRQFGSDGIGGEGFTNVGSAQFLNDAAVTRYLEAANIISKHAIIGAGPIRFAEDPGVTGRELASIRRIQDIYRRYGFRQAAGEGAEPFGMEMFPAAIEAAWRYKHRSDLGKPTGSLDEFARELQVAPKFVAHLWNVLTVDNQSYPLSEISADWNELPSPVDLPPDFQASIREKIEAFVSDLLAWQRRFAGSASAEEEAPLLSPDSLRVQQAGNFNARLSRPRPKRDATNNSADFLRMFEKLTQTTQQVKVRIEVQPASMSITGNPAAVVFVDPRVRLRVRDVVQPDAVPLAELLVGELHEKIAFGSNGGGELIGKSDFALRSGQSLEFEIEMKPGHTFAEFLCEVHLDTISGRDSFVRCVIEDVQSERTYSMLLGDKKSSEFDNWKNGIRDFAEALPQVSHREPAPSDRDPIPEAFDNTYNVAERNHFHTAIKYARSDQFLVNYLLPDEVITELEQAWTDLLTSFEYHNTILGVMAGKHGLDLEGRTIATIEPGWIEQLPEPARSYMVGIQQSYVEMQLRLQSAKPQHIVDCITLASGAWRRELQESEQEALKENYANRLEQSGGDHSMAIQKLIERVLTSPEFIFHTESTISAVNKLQENLQLAYRLSFFLWSSIPDEELLSSAKRGELLSPVGMETQVKRMLSDARARRLATEFFGQWLGFYRFEDYQGIDTTKFPEFDTTLKLALSEQANEYFYYILAHDRPYRELIQSNYNFFNDLLAKHYGREDLVPARPEDDDETSGRELQLVTGLAHRNSGLLSLGALMAATSAPLRTSAVRRGDWVLRRILGTPVPPPPGNAGSIAADEVSSTGQTVSEQLEIHRNRDECRGCHVRIDPLGFALENYDPLGRWRETYSNGVAVENSGKLFSGKPISGAEGLLAHIASNDLYFRQNLVTKLVGYAVGRAETIEDAALVQSIVNNLESDPRFSNIILKIVSSPQFRALTTSELRQPVAITN